MLNEFSFTYIYIYMYIHLYSRGYLIKLVSLIEVLGEKIHNGQMTVCWIFPLFYISSIWYSYFIYIPPPPSLSVCVCELFLIKWTNYSPQSSKMVSYFSPIHIHIALWVEGSPMAREAGLNPMVESYLRIRNWFSMLSYVNSAISDTDRA